MNAKTVNQAQKKFLPCLIKHQECISHGLSELHMKTGDDFDMRCDDIYKNIRSKTIILEFYVLLILRLDTSV